MGRLMGTGSLGMGSLSCGRTIELSAYHRSSHKNSQLMKGGFTRTGSIHIQPILYIWVNTKNRHPRMGGLY